MPFFPCLPFFPCSTPQSYMKTFKKCCHKDFLSQWSFQSWKNVQLSRKAQSDTKYFFSPWPIRSEGSRSYKLLEFRRQAFAELTLPAGQRLCPPACPLSFSTPPSLSCVSPALLSTWLSPLVYKWDKRIFKNILYISVPFLPALVCYFSWNTGEVIVNWSRHHYNKTIN